ncbi:MAG: DNA polymerase-3 subunit gamma/tau [Saprospiraceae bacterium]|jgi:DNA polymerase-3 subunit gamma/tau
MSNFVVSARKYRPARFDEVVGQQHVSQTLKNALHNDQMAHAFLFCGPRGVGKTTCARILAKVLNCQNITSDHEACNKCSSCTSFNENASFNITELDAASNNSVEHIRALIEQVRFQPQQGQYKIFIIDEVHMLSQQAFNAFLKTLEEPPPYAIFILATTEKHKIIPTILSRCQIFDFRRIQVADTVLHLQGICEKENIKADKDALHIIGQKADGALRDALSIFDRIASSITIEDGVKSISYDQVIENLNVLDYDYYFKIVDAMLLEDVAKVLLTFDDILKKGFEADIFINGLADHLRNLLVSKDEATLQLLEVSDGLKGRYKQQAIAAPSSFILTALNIANECDINYKMARNKRLHVEMAIIKMTYISRAVELSKQPLIAVAPQNITEKKTPDLREEAQEEIQKGNGASKSTTVEEETPKINTSTTPTEVRTIPLPVKKDSLPMSGITTAHDTPSLRLDDLEEEFEEDEQVADQVKEVLTVEMLQKVWDQFSKAASSPSLRTTLNKAELQIEEHEVTVIVASTIAKELLQQEHTILMPYIREQLKRDDLTLVIKIDQSKIPVEAKVKPKNLLNSKEKYDLMKEQNPLIDDLRQRFDLRTQ